MIQLLCTTAHPTLYQHPGPGGEPIHPALGRLVQPRHLPRVEATAAEGIPWAADNDCFQGLDERAFTVMVDRLAGLPGCRFVAVPDVLRCLYCDRTVDGYPLHDGGVACACDFAERPRIVYGDAQLTARRFEAWAPGLERRGLPVALVLQDGIHEPAVQEWLAVTWHRLAAVFVGGSTAFKLGPEAADVAREAKRRGLWVHWGRINSRRRFDYIVGTGACDSFDGTKFAAWRKTYLDDGLRWCVEAAAAHQVELTA